MEKPPIFDKLQARAKSLNNDNDDYNDTEQDVLALYRIPATIEIPEEVMTVNEMKKVRFNRSKPVGLHPKQVEEFHHNATQSVKFYIGALEKRDRDVHKLVTEVDKYKTDCTNLKYQLEVFQGKGAQALVNEKGEYLRESDFSETEHELMRKDDEILELQNKISLLQADLTRAQNAQPAPSASHSGLTDAERIELNEYRANDEALKEWEKQVNDSYNALEEENHLLLNANQVLSSKVETLEAEINNTPQIDPAIKIQLTEALEKNQALESNNEDLTAHIDELNEYINTVTSENSEKDNQQVTELSKQVTELSEQVSTLVQERDEATEVANQIEDARVELENQVTDLLRQVAEANESLSQANNSSNGSEDLQMEIETLRESLNELNNYIDDITPIVEAKDIEINDLNSKIEALQEELEHSRKSIGNTATVVSGYVLPPGVKPEDLGIE